MVTVHPPSGKVQTHTEEFVPEVDEGLVKEVPEEGTRVVKMVVVTMVKLVGAR